MTLIGMHSPMQLMHPNYGHVTTLYMYNVHVHVHCIYIYTCTGACTCLSEHENHNSLCHTWRSDLDVEQSPNANAKLISCSGMTKSVGQPCMCNTDGWP